MLRTRRRFIRDSGIGALTFYLGGCQVELTPEQAHQLGVQPKVLSENQANALAALGEVLLPGSVNAGLVEFIDHQLAAPVSEQMLMIKYLGVDPPFDGFYQQGLTALDQVANDAHGASFTTLDASQQSSLVMAMAADQLAEWLGPPAPFFYFVVRNDAVDVTYGTQEGMESLAIPYMAHIVPPSPWGE